MEKLIKKQRLKVGGIFVMPLPNGRFGYGRILEKSSVAIYDYFTKAIENQIDLIVAKPVLFIIAVYDDIIKKGRWEIIGHLHLEEPLKILPMKFIQDALNPNLFSLYDPNTGEIVETIKDKCVGLERAAVWAGNHVEERIMDHINGIPNHWVERDRKATL